jgi:hypothetical protein
MIVHNEAFEIFTFTVFRLPGTSFYNLFQAKTLSLCCNEIGIFKNV